VTLKSVMEFCMAALKHNKSCAFAWHFVTTNKPNE
jgi:hypothetical protein